MRSVRTMSSGPSRLVLALGLLALLVGSRPALAQDGPIQQILDNLPKYQGMVEELRGEKFAKDVPGSKQSLEDFEKFVKKSLAEDLPAEWVAGWQASLRKLGLLPLDYELADALVEFVRTQAGAYYDPKSAAFYVVRANMQKQMLETMVVHELQHALQDQLFDLESMVDEAREHENNDRESVVSFLVEGEATFLMTLHQLKAMGLEGAGAAPLLELQLGPARKMHPDLLRELQAMADPGGDMKEAMDALEGMPHFIVRVFTDPYSWGAYAIFKVHAEKGWKGVADLFENPPSSTEMLLHPEKLLGEEDPPLAVEPPDVAGALGEGWKKTFDDTMGEHGTLAMLDEYLYVAPKRKPDPMTALMSVSSTPGEKAAAGWGGDRYSLYERKGGWTALAWHTKWDTEKDAEEFFEGFQKGVTMHFEHPIVFSPSEDVFVNTVGSDYLTERIAVRLRGKDVAIVIAPAFVPAAEAAEAILESR